VGLISESEIAKGECSVVLNTAMGPIKAHAIVRHVRKSKDKYRVGVELVGFSRLDGSRWRRLTGEAA
jgi:hypothetical protein